MSARRKNRPFVLAIVACVVTAGCALPSSGASATTTAAPAVSLPPLRKFKAVDADNHNVLINRPEVITLLLGTNEDSQDAARQAGKAVHIFQGRPDFQLMVVVDLRDSIASWVPSVVLAQMRTNLDSEALELKPFYLKNGNKGNPRNGSHVIADFKGTICPQLGWTETSDNLRAILFGADGREIKRWDKLEDMNQLQADVRAAIQAFMNARQAKAAAAAKSQGTKLLQPPNPGPPLLPPTSTDNPK